MPRLKQIDPPYLMRARALVQACEGMASVKSDDPQYLEYLDMAQHWHSLLGTFFSPVNGSKEKVK